LLGIFYISGSTHGSKNKKKVQRLNFGAVSKMKANPLPEINEIYSQHFDKSC